MRTALRRDGQRRRQTFRLESLEDRGLLSVLTPPANVLVLPPPKVTSIHGHVVGIQASAGELYQVPPGYTSYSGHGVASSLGYVYFGNQHLESPVGVVNPTVNLLGGTALLTTTRGEEITVAYVGNAQTAFRGRSAVSLVGTITGGTGRFAGITGTFSATGFLRAPGRISIDFTLTPKFPTF